MSHRFTVMEKHEAMLRELQYRKRVYPRLVDSGRMSSQKMGRQIAIIEEIIEDYAVKLPPPAQGKLL